MDVPQINEHNYKEYRCNYMKARYSYEYNELQWKIDWSQYTEEELDNLQVCEHMFWEDVKHFNKYCRWLNLPEELQKEWHFLMFRKHRTLGYEEKYEGE